MREIVGKTRKQIWTSKTAIAKERRLRVADEIGMTSEANQLINKQYGELMRRADLISVQLEIAFQRAQQAHNPLEDEMHRAMAMDRKTNDISEVHSYPRVTEVAKQFGLAEGWSLDLTTEGEMGNKWDFSRKGWQKKALRKIETMEPTLIIASPVCINCSIVMNLNWRETGLDERKRRMDEARVHLEFCAKIYRGQHQEGRGVPHGHPLGATCWGEPGVTARGGMDLVIKTKARTCCYGMTRWTKDGWTHVKKPTGFMTHSQFLVEELNEVGEGKHDHVVLEGRCLGMFSRTRQAHTYSIEMCNAICRGVRAHLKADAMSTFSIGTIKSFQVSKSEEARRSANESQRNIE